MRVPMRSELLPGAAQLPPIGRTQVEPAGEVLRQAHPRRSLEAPQERPPGRRGQGLGQGPQRCDEGCLGLGLVKTHVPGVASAVLAN